MTQTSELQPWYRQFWPWFLIALPTTAVVASVATLFIAMHEPDGLVVDDYYKEGLAINQVLERDQTAQRLGLQADARFGENGSVEVVLRSGEADMPGALTMRLLHPTRAAQDVIVELRQGQDGVYRGTIGALAAGHWHVVISPAEGSWRLTGRIAAPEERQARLD